MMRDADNFTKLRKLGVIIFQNGRKHEMCDMAESKRMCNMTENKKLVI